MPLFYMPMKKSNKNKKERDGISRKVRLLVGRRILSEHHRRNRNTKRALDQHRQTKQVLIPSNCLKKIGCRENTLRKNGSTFAANSSRELPVKTLKQRSLASISIKYLEAALCKNPWYISRKNVKFPADPPDLFYPPLCAKSEKDIHKKCKRCISGEEFFNNQLSKKYTSTLNKIKKNNGDVAKEMVNFCANAVKYASECKAHEMQEFSKFVLVTSRAEFKDYNPYKLGFERLNRMQKHLNEIESKRRKMERKLAPTLSESGLLLNNKCYKTCLHHIQEANILIWNFQKRIEEFILSQQKLRIKFHPTRIKDLAKSNEELFLNRVSNAIVLVEWLKSRLNEYRTMVDGGIKSFKKPEENFSKAWDLIKAPSLPNLPIKFCNTGQRPMNKFLVSLPPSVSHLYAFAAGQQISQIHPSWHRTLLKSSKVSEEIHKLDVRNWELEKSMVFLEDDIQRIEIERRMSVYMQNRFLELGRNK